MIKNTRQGSGLKDYINQIPFIDTNQVSKNYFRVMDFPTRLFVGKNSFRISGNDETLVKGSMIYIDVVDANGDIMYHEVLSVKNRDMSRTVVIYVYPDTPPGEAKIYIAGRLKKHPITGESIPYSDSPVSLNNKDIPNLIWTANSPVVTNKANTSEVLFIREPKIIYSEKLVSYSHITTSSFAARSKIYSGSQKLDIQSRTVPIQYSNDSVFEYEGVEGDKRIRPIPNISNNIGEGQRSIAIPDSKNLTVIKIDVPVGTVVFTTSIVGGTITLQNISVPTPPDAVPGTTISIPDYSASIIEWRNHDTLVVSHPFKHVAEYTTKSGERKKVLFDQLNNHTDWNVRYYDTGSESSKTWVSESFVAMEIMDLEPAAGTVNSIKVSYKPVGSFGNFIDSGEYAIGETNLLVDSSSYDMTVEDGIIQRPIGVFKGNQLIHWQSFGIGGGIPIFLWQTANYSTLQYSVRLAALTGQSDSKFICFKLKPISAVLTAENTEYKLSFKCVATTPSSSPLWYKPFLDVYISGSGVSTDIINRGTVEIQPNDSISLGTFIGTVDSNLGKEQYVEMYFIAKERKYISPVFAARSGQYYFTDIKLTPRNEIGFSPNHAKFNIPLNRFEKKSELIINVEYLNSDGVKSDINSKLYGVFFRGGASELSQSIVVLKQDVYNLSQSLYILSQSHEDLEQRHLNVSSSLSWRVTGTISGSDIRFIDDVNGQVGKMSRLEITGRDSEYSTGGEIGLVANTASMTGGTRVLATNENVTKPSVNDYVHSQFMGSWDGSTTLSCSVKYPYLNRSDNHQFYTSNVNTDIVHFIYDMDVMAVGYSGSFYNDYQGSYVWGGKIRSRVMMPQDYNNKFVMYDAFVSTASMDIYDGYERFGLPKMSAFQSAAKTTAKENAFVISATQSIDTGSGTLDITYYLKQTPITLNEAYDVYLMTSVKILKMEFFTNNI